MDNDFAKGTYSTGPVEVRRVPRFVTVRAEHLADELWVVHRGGYLWVVRARNHTEAIAEHDRQIAAEPFPGGSL